MSGLSVESQQLGEHVEVCIKPFSALGGKPLTILFFEKQKV
jgi:hypothetical protein